MFEDYTVLITGPTTGIGYDLADLFAREKSNLILVSRNEQKLKDIQNIFSTRHGITCHVIPCDLSRPGAAEALVREVRTRSLAVDVLVNNAGYGVYGKFHEESLQPQIGMIELHVTSLTHLTHAFLPGMLKKGRGGILNVASTGGFQSVPIENVYCSTKAYAVHFTEALAEELRDTPVRVTCLCPGPTDTPFFDQPLMKSCSPAKLRRMSSRRVAEKGLEGFKRNKTLVVTGLFNKFLIFGTRLAPRKLITRVARKVVERTATPQR